MQYCGFRDTPIKETAEECLGLGEYAGALADFIVQCDTPMTIAIQGDWGSGKTSMIHMIINQLPPTAPWVYINTWQFAQFDRQSDIAISVLTEFVDGLGVANNDTSNFKKVARFFCKHAGKIATAVDVIGGPGSVVEGAVKVAEKVLDVNGNDKMPKKGEEKMHEKGDGK